MSLKKVYLSGNVENRNRQEKSIWRKTCEEWFKNNTDGFIVIDPLAFYSYDWIDYESHFEVFRFCHRKIKESDIVLVNLSNIRKSVITICELVFAYERDIPIIGFNCDYNYEPHPWIDVMLDRKFVDVELALDYIKNYYNI